MTTCSPNQVNFHWYGFVLNSLLEKPSSSKRLSRKLEGKISEYAATNEEFLSLILEIQKATSCAKKIIGATLILSGGCSLYLGIRAIKILFSSGSGFPVFLILDVASIVVTIDIFTVRKALKHYNVASREYVDRVATKNMRYLQSGSLEKWKRSLPAPLSSIREVDRRGWKKLIRQGNSLVASNLLILPDPFNYCFPRKFFKP